MSLRCTLSVLTLASLVSLAGCNSQPPAPAPATTPSATSPAITPASPTAPIPGQEPLAVVPEVEFNFGVTEVGQEFSHVFEIRNEGVGPLELFKGKPSCTTCTSFEIDKSMIPPGGVAKATVKWHIQAKNPEFRQYAPINTNDPKNKEIKLYVVGKVENRINLEPSERWDLGDIEEGKDRTFRALLSSSLLDAFEIDTVEINNPKLTVKVTPLTAEDMTSTENLEKKLKSGYYLDAVLSHDVPVGDIREPIYIKLKAPKEISLKVDVVSKRKGPLQIIGPGWSSEHMRLDLGKFDAAKGVNVTVQLFTQGLEGELQFDKVECDEPGLQVKVTKDQQFKGKNNRFRYAVEFSMAPGSKPSVHSSQHPLHVKVVTNQPLIGTIEFKLIGRGL